MDNLENPDVTRSTSGPAKDLAALCGSAQRFSRASITQDGFGMENWQGASVDVWVDKGASAGAGASEGDNGRGGLSGDRNGGVSENGVQA
jgi:hypothetical protein